MHGEIEMGLAGHDDMHVVVQMRNGEPVRRIQAGLRRDECPGAEPGPKAGVCHSRLEGGKQSEKQ
jgi:hypothetical protein